MSLDMLISRLVGQSEESQAMCAGTAFHSFLEAASQFEQVEHFAGDGFVFSFDLEAEIALPGIKEIKTEKELRIAGKDVTLVAKADIVDGRTVYDHKLKTSGQFDAEFYIDSMQWRTYLWLFEANTFVYNVFEGRFCEEDHGATQVVIDDFHQLRLHGYPGMAGDVLESLEGLVQFMVTHVPERVHDAVGDAKALKF